MTSSIAGTLVTGLCAIGVGLLASVGTLTNRHAAANADVFVVGTLYKRHETISTYDLAAVRRIILAIKPDVLVVDCTPREVRDRTVHASKVEYAQVIFPLIDERGYQVYAAEPDEPLFSEIVQAVAGAHQRFQDTRPDDAAALRRYVEATYAVLGRHWRSPADVQDELTGQLLTAKKVLEGQLVGPQEADGSRRWNQHWAGAIRRAAAENPGARVLALTGIENRPWIMQALDGAPGLTLVDMPAWLTSHPQ